VAENLLSHLVENVQWNEVNSYVDRGFVVVDVRSVEEFAQGSLPSAINIPLDELREQLSKISAKQVIVTCQVGQRGYVATLLLNELGFHALNLDGGYETWSHSPAAVLPQLVG
jgi:rhodanese-related sulfurtransferase